MLPIIVIPARLDSSRLPNKLLLDDTGQPLIFHAIRNACDSSLAKSVVVASEDQKILDIVSNSFHVPDVITFLTPKCASGTERVSWVANRLVGDVDVIINLQGDEPELSGAQIDYLIQNLLNDSTSDVSTFVVDASKDDYESPNVVKVVADHGGNAMYFSRCSIPHGSDTALKHIGAYAYRMDFLVALKAMEETTLQCESLEQLQWLQSGFRVKLVELDADLSGIDTRAEYDAFVARFLDD